MYVRSTGSPLPSTPVWSLAKDQGDYWYPAKINVPAMQSGTYDVIIEGVKGQAGNIAIDDVFLSQGGCQQGWNC